MQVFLFFLGHLEQVVVELVDLDQDFLVVFHSDGFDEVGFVLLVDLLHHVEPEMLQGTFVGEDFLEDGQVLEGEGLLFAALLLARRKEHLAHGLEVDFCRMVRDSRP